MDDHHVVEIRDLEKRFPVGDGYFTALSDITLNVEVGEFTGLVGPRKYGSKRPGTAAVTNDVQNAQP